MTVGPLERDADTAPFLDGTARGELLLRRCPTGHWSEPSASTCTACGSVELSWASSFPRRSSEAPRWSEPPERPQGRWASSATAASCPTSWNPP